MREFNWRGHQHLGATGGLGVGGDVNNSGLSTYYLREILSSNSTNVSAMNEYKHNISRNVIPKQMFNSQCERHHLICHLFHRTVPLVK